MTKKKTKLGLVANDGWLEPYEGEIEARLNYFNDKLHQVKQSHKSLEQFASEHDALGLNYDPTKKGYWYREWAPAAKGLSLLGDFNNWDKESHRLDKKENGLWEIFIGGSKNVIEHESLLKVHVRTNDGSFDRIPAYIKRAVQDPETYDFAGQHWNPSSKFEWSDQSFDPKKIVAPIIYECHLGLAQEKEGVGTYNEFTEQILPRIKELGYNCIQMMAIQEHPYYGSFGYHVSNFFAPTSRFGTPEELKNLIDTAHSMNIAVVMDIVHSHAVKNLSEGLNNFDGSEAQYFHEGGKGYHTGWDSKLFDYSKDEVLQFLLSNVKYWIQEFHFDGFRFDGVTSMMYEHHGEGVAFDHYDKYFKNQLDIDAIRYLQLANELAHSLKPGTITIAEDMSGMPGICQPIQDGGIGFDYRLAMGIPDYWIKLLKHTSDENWKINEIWDVLSNRRYKEKTIAYAESHDQALVGDKTLAFWLMDKEMYWHMSKDDNNPIIERGMALHKLIRLLTGSIGGEGYLNFIGNEFGHPEWIDFPREGNDWSYKYARRQWSLVDNPDLKYKMLNNFDREMVALLEKNNVLAAVPAQQLNMDTTNNVIIYERANLVFVVNLSTSKSIADYRLQVPMNGKYEVVLNSDSTKFGGLGRIDESVTHSTDSQKYLSIYITNRTALVLKMKQI